MTVSIRRARRGDGEGVAEVWRRVGAYYAALDPGYFQPPDTTGLAGGLDGVIQRGGDDALALVVELDGHVMGWLSARVARPAEHARAQMMRQQGWIRLVVDALIVDPSAWRRGAGRALLEVAEEWGRERGAQLVRLETYADSPVSVPFYEQGMGYSRRSVVYEKRLAE
jgi:GNAT superfamily N-acetyltransferase